MIALPSPTNQGLLGTIRLDGEGQVTPTLSLSLFTCLYIYTERLEYLSLT